MPIDRVSLDFDGSSLLLLNLLLGALMFGIALDLRVRDFQALGRAPRAPAIGLVAQFVLLPVLAFGLTRSLELPPSVKLGMILVSACPGGSISNFVTHLAGGRVSTSVGMTAVSSLAALVMTPVNLTFWGRLHPETAPLVTEVALDPVELLGQVALLLVAPVVLGMVMGSRLPALAERARAPVRTVTVVFFAIFVATAFGSNLGPFREVVGTVFAPVALLNLGAFGIGLAAAYLGGLDPPDRRAVTIEVGIQNSGLGLVLALTFFEDLGGMAVVCAWWGIWHVLAGLLLAVIWTRGRLRPAEPGPFI